MAFLHAYEKDMVMLVIKKVQNCMHCSINGDLFLLYALQSNIGFAGLFEYPEIRVVEGFGVRKNTNKITYFAITLLLYFEPYIVI